MVKSKAAGKSAHRMLDELLTADLKYARTVIADGVQAAQKRWIKPRDCRCTDHGATQSSPRQSGGERNLYPSAQAGVGYRRPEPFALMSRTV